MPPQAAFSSSNIVIGRWNLEGDIHRDVVKACENLIECLLWPLGPLVVAVGTRSSTLSNVSNCCIFSGHKIIDTLSLGYNKSWILQNCPGSFFCNEPLFFSILLLTNYGRLVAEWFCSIVMKQRLWWCKRKHEIMFYWLVITW